MRRRLFGGVAAAACIVGAGGCAASDQTASTTRTVTVHEAAAPVPKPVSHPVPRAKTFSNCDANIQVKTATTTCTFAQNAFWSYWTTDRSASFSAWSPATHSSFDVSCAGTSRIVCTTADGGVVRFSRAAVDGYSQTQADAFAAGHDLGPDPASGNTDPSYDEDTPGDDDSLPDEDAPPPATQAGENIPNYDEGRGTRVQCGDGMYSHSGGIQGACSGHGGVAP